MKLRVREFAERRPGAIPVGSGLGGYVYAPYARCNLRVCTSPRSCLEG